MGAAIPSSERLANLMASFVPHPCEGLVVELGAGTGSVTEALLRRGVPPDQLLAIERSPKMAEILQKRFPSLRIIHGDACHLGELVKQHQHGSARKVDVVVSSLPLRSLPFPVLTAVEAQIHEHLTDDGSYIQFTYDVRPGIPSPLGGFVRCDSKVVWLNAPPARADLFRRER